MITGPPETPYEGGQYHGTLTFPSDYPFKPPAIRMFTPSGRFRPGMRLCLSISDYHPKTWNPAWSVSTILTGLLSFMAADETTAGSVAGTDESRREFARKSKTFNNKSNSQFVQQYPELVEANEKDIAAATAHKKAQSSSKSSARLVPVNLKRSTGAVEEVPAPEDEGNEKRGFSRGQKLICVAILFVSWLVASKLFALRA